MTARHVIHRAKTRFAVWPRPHIRQLTDVRPAAASGTSCAATASDPLTLSFGFAASPNNNGNIISQKSAFTCDPSGNITLQLSL